MGEDGGLDETIGLISTAAECLEIDIEREKDRRVLFSLHGNASVETG